jgi:hypothetical protein
MRIEKVFLSPVLNEQTFFRRIAIVQLRCNIAVTIHALPKTSAK